MNKTLLLVIPLLIASTLLAADDWKPVQRRLPGGHKPAPDSVVTATKPILEKIEARIAALKSKPDLAEFIPDAEVFVKAVRFAIDRDEFFGGEDPAKLLDIADKRITLLEAGQHPFYNQTGSGIVGYRSYIDNSVQPFFIDVPKNYTGAKPVPLTIWLHGRGDTDTEIHFMRGGGRGPFNVENSIGIAPFGRNCLGFKAAGEVDILECVASVKKRFNIDPDRVLLMGFSMGGAGSWTVGGHYADQFCAVQPGAGYVDVARYQKIPKEKFPVWYEQKLWGVNDMPDYVRNYFNTTTVGYGGDQDSQRQAGEIMAESYKVEGREMKLIVGKNMGHGLTKDAIDEIRILMQAAANKGREPYAKEISLQTRTLRYNQMKWAAITLLQKHWEDSRLDGKIIDDTHIEITTKNVAGLKLIAPWQDAKGERDIEIKIDGQPLTAKFSDLEKSGVEFQMTSGKWQPGSIPSGALVKTHGLTGPIDDAFMDSFLVVIPSGACQSPAVEKWIQFDLAHAKERWRDVFRADLPCKKDTDITADDIARYNLVCWGDETSNAIIKQAMNAKDFPIKRDGDSLTLGDKKFPAATSIPVLIYPNPLNPKKYIVLNSITTFREDDDGTNSRQNPRLPDWAILDANTPPNQKSPGQVLDADFFDEAWKFQRSQKP